MMPFSASFISIYKAAFVLSEDKENPIEQYI